jgi:hypothetical protein
MFRDIVLNEQGETLRNRDSEDRFFRDLTDDSPFPKGMAIAVHTGCQGLEVERALIGEHGVCQMRLMIDYFYYVDNNEINYHVVTDKTENNFAVIHCRKCGLRMHIPVEIKTYGQLRQHLARFQPKEDVDLVIQTSAC